MNRRDFLRGLAGAGLAVATGVPRVVGQPVVRSGALVPIEMISRLGQIAHKTGMPVGTLSRLPMRHVLNLCRQLMQADKSVEQALRQLIRR